MGICYSKIDNKRQAECPSENEYDKKINLKLKKNRSGDFAAFISKLSGAGAAVAAAEERALHQIHGRLFSNGANSFACLYTQQGKKGTNQDAMLVWENFCTRSNTSAVFCGVFDGHGPFGHMVARKVRDSLPLFLREEWEAKSDREQISAGENGNHAGMILFDEFMDGDGFDSIEVDDNEKIPEMHMPLKRSILKAFKLMDKELKLHPTIDCFCSGTTAVTLIMQGQDLIIGNIGDSRAVLATRDQDNSLMAVQLTVDLKPNLPREAARIQKCKGRVFALQDEPEVARVWLPNSNSPGLAMARAFGDFCLKDFGLISIPDVYYHHITVEDEFVVLATDGVWDVLSNKEAVDIVASAPGRATAARALVDCATRAWRLKYPTSKNDDCAVVCLFLQQVSGANLARAQINISTALEVETEVTREGGTEGSNIDAVASCADLVHSDTVKVSGANVTKAKNNQGTDLEVEMKNVPKEGSAEGSNIDVVSSRADDLVHSDNVIASGANLAKAQNNITTDSSEVEMKNLPKEGISEGSNFDVPVHLDNVKESGLNVAKAENNITTDSELEMKNVLKEGGTEGSNTDIVASHADLVIHSDNITDSSEIESVVEPVEEKHRIHGQSKRSLAECLSTREDEEWSALEGVTRVNSLLSLPRFMSSEKLSRSWRKWL